MGKRKHQEKTSIQELESKLLKYKKLLEAEINAAEQNSSNDDSLSVLDDSISSLSREGNVVNN